MRHVKTASCEQRLFECDFCKDADPPEMFSLGDKYYCDRCFEGFLELKRVTARAFAEHHCEITQATTATGSRKSTNFRELVAGLDRDDPFDGIMYGAIRTRCAELLFAELRGRSRALAVHDE